MKVKNASIASLSWRIPDSTRSACKDFSSRTNFTRIGLYTTYLSEFMDVYDPENTIHETKRNTPNPTAPITRVVSPRPFCFFLNRKLTATGYARHWHLCFIVHESVPVSRGAPVSLNAKAHAPLCVLAITANNMERYAKPPG